MKVAKTLLLLCTVGLIAADEPKKNDDAEAFKGNWSVLSMSRGGRSLPEGLIKVFQCHFDGKGYTNTVAKQLVEEGSYTFDSSKMPKTIDFEIKKGHDQGKRQLSIYKFEGNTLTLVMTEAGSTTRPTSFKLEPRDQMIEVVLERAKP